MPRQFGVSDFGEAEDRLRRSLSLEGRIPVDVDPQKIEIVPTVLLADATAPGMAVRRDRRFYLGAQVISGSVMGCLSNTPDGVIIERVYFAHSGGSGCQIQQLYQGSNSGGVFAISSLAGKFLDRAQISEVSPLLMNVAAAVLPVIDAIYRFPNQDTIEVVLNFFLAQGAQLYFRNVVLTTGVIDITVFGRTF